MFTMLNRRIVSNVHLTTTSKIEKPKITVMQQTYILKI